MIVARVLDPASKLATARGLAPETAASSLGQVLELGAVDEDDLYQALDWLVERQDRIERRLARRTLENGTLVLYDVSSTWVEGRHCDLAAFGKTLSSQIDVPIRLRQAVGFARHGDAPRTRPASWGHRPQTP